MSRVASERRLLEVPVAEDPERAPERLLGGGTVERFVDVRAPDRLAGVGPALHAAGLGLRVRESEGRFVQTLKAEGDGLFDRPEWEQPVEGAEPGTVVEVYQRGYRLGESVLRPARVVVAG